MEHYFPTADDLKCGADERDEKFRGEEPIELTYEMAIAFEKHLHHEMRRKELDGLIINKELVEEIIKDLKNSL